MHYTAAALLAALPVALGAAHDVTVGANGALAFSPTELTAAVGDTIDFHFMPGDHSVAQSTFSNPCQPSGSNAIYSGFFNPNGGVDSMMFSMLVNSTDPIWLYCSQIGHCTAGMSMVINAPSGETLSAYQKAAQSAKVSSPSAVFGGVIVANQNGFSLSGGSSSSAVASSSAAATSSAAASSSAAAMTSSATAMSSAAAGSSSAAGGMTTTAAASSASVAASASSGYAGAAAATRVPAAAFAAAGGLAAWALF